MASVRLVRRRRSTTAYGPRGSSDRADECDSPRRPRLAKSSKVPSALRAVAGDYQVGVGQQADRLHGHGRGLLPAERAHEEDGRDVRQTERLPRPSRPLAPADVNNAAGTAFGMTVLRPSSRPRWRSSWARLWFDRATTWLARDSASRLRRRRSGVADQTSGSLICR